MNFKKFAVISFAFVLALGLTVQPAAAQLSLGADFATWLDATSNDGASPSSGFATGATNVHVFGDVAPGVEAYIELRGPDSGGDVRLREGYTTVSDIVPGAEVKFGAFELNYGETVKRRSTFGDVQSNPFIGNTLADFVAVQPGIEFSGQGGPVAWTLGLTDGTPAGNFNTDRGWAITPKVKGNFAPGIEAAFSYYQVDHSDVSASPTFPNDNLVSGGAGESYPGAAPALAQVTSITSGAGAGDNISAMQLDFGYEAPVGTDINVWYGTASAENSAGNETSGSYQGVDATHPLTPQTYAAFRWNVATSDKVGGASISSNNTATRMQFALGHNLNENTQAKIEYVTQDNEANAPTGTATEASGIIAEGSVSF